MNLTRAQRILQAQALPAWLLYSFGTHNPLALEALGLKGQHLTRRFAYLIPASGTPVLLAHRIETQPFAHLPGERRTYHSWDSFVEALREMLTPYRRVAMDYVPGGQIPYLSRVDAGTIELIRGLGVEVVSAAEILLHFQTWGTAELERHRRAVAGVEAARDAALAFIRTRLPEAPPTELEVQAVMLQALTDRGLVTDHPPIVAFGPNAALPHYAPSAGKTRRLEPGDVVLLDVWAKEPNGVYADITWMAGWQAPEEAHRAFEAVREARDRAVAFVREAYRAGRHPAGFEVDRAARAVLEAAGYGAFVLHRTGHHLGADAPHGNGTHLDDLETHDTRPLIPGLAFTVEPGVYPGPFGVRSEINVFLREDGPVVTTEAQTALTVL